MFTGLIEAVGKIRGIQHTGTGSQIEIECPFSQELSIGESIAVNGVCLTATVLREKGFIADVMAPTLKDTILGELKPGMKVNLERALQYGGRLDGHLVTGHVDGVGSVEHIHIQGDTWTVGVRVPERLRKYLANKGSVAINGVSLTLQDTPDYGFEIGLIPHTRQITALGELKTGQRMNIECDILARYLERLMGLDKSSEGLTLEKLAQLGY